MQSCKRAVAGAAPAQGEGTDVMGTALAPGTEGQGWRRMAARREGAEDGHLGAAGQARRDVPAVSAHLRGNVLKEVTAEKQKR